MLKYHIGAGGDDIVSFSFSQAQTCELIEESSWKCWKLAAAVAYICMAAGGVLYALIGIGASL